MKGWQLWLILRELKRNRYADRPPVHRPPIPPRIDAWIDEQQELTRKRKAEKRARREQRRRR